MTLPFVRDFFMTLARQSPLSQVAEAAARGEAVSLSGLTPSAQLLAAAQLQRLTQRAVMLLVADNRVAEEWRDTLATFADLTGSDAERPRIMPAFELDPYEGLSPHAAILEQRAVAAWRAVEGQPFLIVPAVAAATRLPPPERYRKLARRLRKGDFLDLESLAEQLARLGYQRTEPVEMPGQFSIRGGLLDVFSPEALRPVRLELLGDEIESLREFDPATQRSVPSAVGEAVLLPLTALPLDAELRAQLGDTPAPGWEFRVPGLLGFRHSVFELAE